MRGLMEKEIRKNSFKAVLLVTFMACFSLSYLLSIYFREELTGELFQTGLISDFYGDYFAVSLAVYLLNFLLLDLAGVRPIHRGRASYRFAVLMVFSSILCLLLANALFQLFFISRGFLMVLMLLLVALSVVTVFLINMMIRLIFKNGLWSKRVLLVGDEKENTWQRRHLEQNSSRAVEFFTLGTVTFDDNGSRKLISNLLDKNIDEVHLNIPYKQIPGVEKFLILCNCLDASVFMREEFMSENANPAKEVSGPLLRNKLLRCKTIKLSRMISVSPSFRLKMVLDFVLALVSLVLLLPLFALIALLIRLDSRGPVFFSQWRIGRHGKKFRMLKFRSMVDGAEQLKKALKLEEQNLHTGPAFKLAEDPRVTRVGRWLRKYSLDELPQLVNVILGDMSMVGPRPPIQQEVELYEFWHFQRLSVLPGITGLWQVTGRNMIKDFNEWVKLDIQYINNWSFWLDLKILYKTLIVVLTARGAA